MPKYQAITKTDFANLRWKRYESYHFAALDAVAPLVVQELPKACMTLPIAFIQQGEAFVPAAVQVYCRKNTKPSVSSHKTLFF